MFIKKIFRATGGRRGAGPGKAEVTLQADGVDRSRPAASPRQIHPLCEEKAQLLAYDSKPAPEQAASPPPPSAAFPPPPNIVVEAGRIEFAKTPPGGVAPTIRAPQNSATPVIDEKCDVAKESLEARVLELERALEAEQRSGQRERLAVTRLQRQLARREVLQRDVDRERRLRLDTEGRLRDCTAEADRCRARLHALQRELSRMEDSMRTMLQYKSRAEQLKQEKTNLTVAYENRIHQFQNTLIKLGHENDALKKQLRTLEAAGAGEVQTALLERLRLLENDNCSLSREAEVQRRQYERCLDDVANQVVRALLSQKGLREEISTLQRRIKDLEAQNRALTAVLVQQLQPQPTPSPSSMNVLLPGLCTATPSPNTPTTSLSTPSSAALWEDMALEPMLWVPVARPRSLPLDVGAGAVSVVNNVAKCCLHRRNRPLIAHAVANKKVEDVGSESPESGNRDEGYSTMSSDVQADAAPRPPEAPGKGLEDVKEASDETDAVVESRPIAPVGHLVVVEDACDPDVLYIPLGVVNPRHSFPPAKDLLPFQHVMRSFSDSHLCLKLAAATPRAQASSCSLASSASSSPSVLVLETTVQPHPLRRTKATVSLTTPGAGSATPYETTDDDESSVWWDTDYIQHWLRLDETRGALQQQHRDMLELEYDHAELEDWSMSCDDFGAARPALPSIRETEDDCPWSAELAFLMDMDAWPHALLSPGGSWSSASEDCCHSYSSKRSSAAMSDDAAGTESPAVGTDFTRDFYRLVKFESTKSLASTSSRSLADVGGSLKRGQEPPPDREQALQNVLSFIAEQQQYCASRAQADERPSADQETSTNDEDDIVSVLSNHIAVVEETQEVHTLVEIDLGRPDYDENERFDSSNRKDRSTESLLNEQNSSINSMLGCNVIKEELDARDVKRLDLDDAVISDTPEKTDDDASPLPPPLDSLRSRLVTVVEEEEPPGAAMSESLTSTVSTPDTVVNRLQSDGSPGSVLVVDARAVSFHERATSKDVIDELNRMIRKGEEAESGDVVNVNGSKLDVACCCPTGWVHVERDIDFTDPKARANLLDVMLASSGSSGGSSSSNSSSSSSESGDEPADYQHLHRLHRFRRQKKASATRDQLGVLRYPASAPRPSIIGRDDFFVRYGDKEREAVASFDFLEELSTTSVSGASSCDTLGSRHPAPPTLATPTPSSDDSSNGLEHRT